MSDETNLKKWQILQAKVKELKILQAFELFRENGIEPILIKGFAAARFYPNNTEREYVDLDFAVRQEDFSRAKNVLKSNIHGLAVDLHEGFRHLDTLDWNTLYKNSELIGDEKKIRVLSPEDHLRVLCVHWLTDGGENKERLLDIFYAVENRPESFDWSKCLDVVDDNRKHWVLMTIGLAHKYLNLNISDLPIDTKDLYAPDWLLKRIEKEWESGVRIIPLEFCLNDKKMLWQQIKKRIPPNPIHATIDMNGRFDDKPRIFYQTGNFFARIPNSYKRIKETILTRYRNNKL